MHVRLCEAGNYRTEAQAMAESLLSGGWDHFCLYRAQPDTEVQPAAARSEAGGEARCTSGCVRKCIAKKGAARYRSAACGRAQRGWRRSEVHVRLCEKVYYKKGAARYRSAACGRAQRGCGRSEVHVRLCETVYCKKRRSPIPKCSLRPRAARLWAKRGARQVV